MFIFNRKNLKFISFQKAGACLLLVFFLLSNFKDVFADTTDNSDTQTTVAAAAVVNTPPTITLNGTGGGNTRMLIPLSSVFVDPGATASDKEDGDLTSKIIVTGANFDTKIIQCDDVVYTVTDSGGLSASVTRVVCMQAPPNNPPQGNPPTVTLTANPTTGTSPLNTILSWTTTNNPTTCTATGGWAGSKSVTGGTENISNLTATTTFTITCTNAYGSGTSSVTVTPTTNNGGNPPTVTLTANPMTGASPLNTVLTWTTTNNPTTCTASNGWTGSKNVAGGTQNITGLTATTTFVITCTNAYGSNSSSVTVTPTTNNGGNPPTVTLTANPTTGASPLSTILSWTTTNTPTTCTASNGWTGSKNVAGGTENISNLTATTTFTITCTNSYGSGTSSVTVTPTTGGGGNPPTVTLTANPTTGASPLNTTLTWVTANNPVTCTASNGWTGAKNISGGTENITGLTATTTFTITCTNAYGSGTSSVTVTPTTGVCIAPTITSSTTLSGTVGQPFSYQLTATSVTSGTITYSLGTSVLPTGLTFNANTGILSGTPSVSGVFPLTLIAINACGQTVADAILTINTGGGGGPNINLAITKTVDKPNPNVGDTVTYTISVINNGPDNATGVKVTDIFPGNLNYVSFTTSVGTFNPTTNVWTIGALAKSTVPTTLSLVTTVKAGTQGQKITNTAIVNGNENDTDLTNNTTSVDINVTNPNSGCTTNCGSGPLCTVNCGGGNPPSVTLIANPTTGNAPLNTLLTWTTTNNPTSCTASNGWSGSKSVSGGSENISNLTVNTTFTITCTNSFGTNSSTVSVMPTTVGNPPVNPPTPGVCYYLFDYLRRDFANNPVEVKKLQVFLNIFEGEKLDINGVYDQNTENAVDRFQAKYLGDVLSPWGDNKPTGYTYILTKKKVNEIYCNMPFPLTQAQQNEIDTYRNSLTTINTNTNTNTNTTNIKDTNNSIGQVGLNQQNQVLAQNTIPESSLVLPVKPNIGSVLAANVINSGKDLGDLITRFFKWLFGNIFNGLPFCWCTSNGLGWFPWILILIIIVLSVLYYREYKNRKNFQAIAAAKTATVVPAPTSTSTQK